MQSLSSYGDWDLEDLVSEVEKVTAEEWETWKREYPEAFGRKLDDACGVCLDGWLISGAG